MSLIQELLTLRQARLDEDAIETVEPDQLWTDDGQNSGTYISSAVYFVRPIPNSQNFEVVTEENNQRKPFATLTKANLDKSFIPMRPDQTADAEGFIQYRDIDETEAFQYSGDTVNVNIDGSETTLNKGDYLLRRADGNDFVYSVKKEQDFEAAFAEK